MTKTQHARATTRLADYQPPAFLIDQVALIFDLAFARTLVHSELKFRRNPAASASPLRLHGEDLELLAIAIDGRALADAEYTIAEGVLEIPQAPTAGRIIAEMIEETAMAGGGYCLWAGCAAGDTGASMIFKVG